MSFQAQSGKLSHLLIAAEFKHVSAPGTAAIRQHVYLLMCCFAGAVQHSCQGKGSPSSALTANRVPLLPQWQMHKGSLLRFSACELP